MNIQDIKMLEKQDFPEFRDYEGKGRFGRGKYINRGNWVDYPPSHHFETGLITLDIVSDLIESNKKLLSVGCGNAYLERFLVNRMGVKKEQISLADYIEPEHRPPKVPEDFKSYFFDMYQEWPALDDSFDDVMFPDSILLHSHPKEEMEYCLYWLMENALSNLQPNGQIRASPSCSSEHSCPTSVYKNVRDMLIGAGHNCQSEYFPDTDLLVVRKSNGVRK